MEKPRVLIGASVCQKPVILRKFLEALAELELDEFEVKFLFIDDNQDVDSSEMLRGFELGHEVEVREAKPRNEAYFADEHTHHWTPKLALRVADAKNGIIAEAIEGDYDYLFLVDSDLVIDAGLVQHLYEQDKCVISEVFWTKWAPDTIEMPNVWLWDTYEMSHPSQAIEVRQKETFEFLEMLRVPGVYEVGGLGACTLIKVGVLKRGVDFTPIANLSFWGEDRWFCVRAAVAGVGLWADTHLPPMHLYRESDLGEMKVREMGE